MGWGTRLIMVRFGHDGFLIVNPHHHHQFDHYYDYYIIIIMRIVTKNLQTRILPEPCLHLLRQVVKGGVVIIESGQTRVLLWLADCCCSLEKFIGGDLLKEGFGAPRRSRRNKASILSSSLAGLLWQWPPPGLNITQYAHGDWIHEENIAVKDDIMKLLKIWTW